MCVLQTDIYIFFCQIYKMWVDCGLYPELSVEDVKDEVFDMAQPKHPLHITMQDLQVTTAMALLGSHWRCCLVVMGMSAVLHTRVAYSLFRVSRHDAFMRCLIHCSIE